MSARSSFFSICRVLLISVLLTGCGGGDMDDLKTFVADAYKDKKPEIEPLPIIRPFTAYEYSGAEQNDPFNAENILGDNAGADGGRETERPTEPLEEFPLDALKMVGTLVKEDQPWVIVKTSTGLALLASEGNYMGQNNGRITKISPERQLVILSERLLDSAGRWVTREVQVTVD
jgi:type IV pilus assembly protein PilP